MAEGGFYFPRENADRMCVFTFWLCSVSVRVFVYMQIIGFKLSFQSGGIFGGYFR